MRNIDETYKTELNFVDEFNLSRNGMIKEIEQEFNIIRLCLFESQELDEQYQSVLDRIIVMPYSAYAIADREYTDMDSCRRMA